MPGFFNWRGTAFARTCAPARDRVLEIAGLMEARQLRRVISKCLKALGYEINAGAWVRPPPRGGPRKPLRRVSVLGRCLRRCASCLRYVYGMLYVCLCLVCLSQLDRRMQEWAKRQNTLLGRKMALRLILVLCVSGAVPRAGSSFELSVLWSPGMTSQKTGAAHGPRHPSCLNNQDLSASS